MTFFIDSSNNQYIKLAIFNDSLLIKSNKIKTFRNQSEKLLSSIEKMLNSLNINLHNIKKIKVANYGESFTSLRVGVLTANALAYALGIEVESIELDKKRNKKLKNFNIVIPHYSRDVDIKIKKNDY